MCSRNVAWTNQSDLNPSKYDPFPELQNPVKCYENYGCDTSVYLPNKFMFSSVPDSTRTISLSPASFTTIKKPLPSPGIQIQTQECYGEGLNHPYLNLNKTWTVQRPFTL